MSPPDGPRPGAALVFLHNLRCGGNSLNYLFADTLGPDSFFKLGAVAGGSHTHKDFLKAARDDRTRFYLGHFCYGVHRHIRRPTEYFTVLRRPVDRLLSAYAITGARRGENLADWIARTPDARNGMVRRLCGIGPNEDAGCLWDYVRECPVDERFEPGPEHLAMAREIVAARIPVVLLHERRAEGLVLLQRRHRLPPLISVTHAHYNETPSGWRIGRPDPRDVARLIAANRLDGELHETLRRREQARYAAMDETFHRRVAAMRAIAAIGHVTDRQEMAVAEFVDRLEAGLRHLTADGRSVLADDIADLLRGHPDLPPGALAGWPDPDAAGTGE